MKESIVQFKKWMRRLYDEMLKTFGEGGEKAQQAMFGIVESLAEIEDPKKK